LKCYPVPEKKQWKAKREETEVAKQKARVTGMVRGAERALERRLPEPLFAKSCPNKI
jgi:hypothetical protein